MTHKVKNILIIKPSALGDITLAMPALQHLGKTFPEARISWLVRPEYAALVENLPGLDEAIYFDRKILGKWWYNYHAFGELVGLIKKLRKGKFDLVFDFQGLLRSALFGWFSGAAARVGMARSREFTSIFYTDTIEPPAESQHQIDYFQKMVQQDSDAASEVDFGLVPSQQAVEALDGLLAEHNIKKNNYAVIVPGAAHDAKCWPAESFASIADKISEDFGISVIAVGTNSEKPIVECLVSSAKTEIFDFTGKTDVALLVALMANAKVVVSNDTGPGHIANAVGAALAMIFGRTNPARVMPYGRGQCVVAIDPDGRGTKPDNLNPRYDITNITVDEVYDCVRGQLRAKQ